MQRLHGLELTTVVRCPNKPNGPVVAANNIYISTLGPLYGHVCGSIVVLVVGLVHQVL